MRGAGRGGAGRSGLGREAPNGSVWPRRLMARSGLDLSGLWGPGAANPCCAGRWSPRVAAAGVGRTGPHDALIILNMHKWGKTFLQKNFSTHQHRATTNKFGSWIWEPIF